MREKTIKVPKTDLVKDSLGNRGRDQPDMDRIAGFMQQKKGFVARGLQPGSILNRFVKDVDFSEKAEIPILDAEQKRTCFPELTPCKS